MELEDEPGVEVENGLGVGRDSHSFCRLEATESSLSVSETTAVTRACCESTSVASLVTVAELAGGHHFINPGGKSSEAVLKGSISFQEGGNRPAEGCVLRRDNISRNSWLRSWWQWRWRMVEDARVLRLRRLVTGPGGEHNRATH